MKEDNSGPKYFKGESYLCWIEYIILWFDLQFMFYIDVGADAGLLRLKGHKKSLKKNTGHMKNLYKK